jgi:hypothetical protein
MPVKQPAQQGRTQRLVAIGAPLIDDQPAAGVELLLAVFEELPGQMPGRRTGIGVQIEKNQVGRLGRGQQGHGIADTDGQPRIIGQAEVLHGQPRHIRTQLDHLDILQRQVLQAALGQIAGTQAEKQCAFRSRMQQTAEQHGAGIVVLQPGRIGSEYTALLDLITEFEKPVIANFHHPDHTIGIMHLGQQDFLMHYFTHVRLRGFLADLLRSCPQAAHAG